ncbi:hypothetical protein [Nocardioides limicola]|uniref:hypothetical protein n=1 Tax=Nocardioides limicola TaxID=2803368 RepID=UPI00193B25E6|nr:hypothetical protein [Nocardioides sp. DJM-14]
MNDLGDDEFGFDEFGPGLTGMNDGFGDGFLALFALVAIAGVAVTIWKVSESRKMAREAGIDPGRATAMTLLTDDGFEATYLASALKSPTPGQPREEPAPADPATRLKTLDELRSRGLVTGAEYAERRAAIIAEL